GSPIKPSSEDRSAVGRPSPITSNSAASAMAAASASADAAEFDVIGDGLPTADRSSDEGLIGLPENDS
ncbi:MAG: hypothetical protein ACKOA6_05980, partial [Actinomycetota bacterium]